MAQKKTLALVNQLIDLDPRELILKPSLHGMVIAAKLSTVNVKAQTVESNNSANSTQDTWERSFKELGDENPEQVTTGLLLFYPHQLLGYLESNEEGIRKCLQVLSSLASRDVSKLESYRIANIQHNIQNVLKMHLFHLHFRDGMIMRLFSNIFVRSMEAPHEKESKLRNAFKKKNIYDQRLKLTKCMFSIIEFIKKQAPLSVKKALDAIVEKNFSLLPEPYNIEVVACDEEIPDPLENMSKTAGPAVALGEDEVWPMPKEAFQLNVVL